MKKLFLLLLLPVLGCGQRLAVQNDYAENPLGKEQLYSPEDLRQLRKTADSINFAFLQCANTPKYYSLLQTTAQYIKLKYKKDGKAIETLIRQGVSPERIFARFPGVEKKDEGQVVLVFQNHYDWEKEKNVDAVFSGNGSWFAATGLSLSCKNAKAGEWLFSISDIEDDGYRYLEAWRLEKPFKSFLLPEEFGKMIQYTDCMTDTTTELMLEKGAEREEENKPFETLKNYLIVKQGKKIDTTFYVYLEEDDLEYLRKNYHRDEKIRNLLREAVITALEKGNGSNTLEWMADGFYAKDTILLMKRSRIVIGQCSMDPSPREHARDIAVLASQTHQWPVFIRAHLNIMNDRFERTTDGSYAEPGRETYLRELEVLNIPARELLLGTVLTAQNLSRKHYYGNIMRIGRAFTESRQSGLFEGKIKEYMKDERLDGVNRCLLFRLYASYCYQQRDSAARTTKLAALKREAVEYPGFIEKAILSLEE